MTHMKTRDELEVRQRMHDAPRAHKIRTSDCSNHGAPSPYERLVWAIETIAKRQGVNLAALLNGR